MGAGRTRLPWRGAALRVLALLLVIACGRPAGNTGEALPRGTWLAFEGTWSASGTRQTLHQGPGHRASIVELTGSMLLVGERRLGVGFQAEAIGFSDAATGLTGRCVWTDAHGNEVWSELQGQHVGSGNRVVGTLTGGTGRFEGITGEYAFEWQYVVAAEDGEISGRAVGLTGRACIGTPPPGEPPAAVPPAVVPPAGEGER
jgi:hypothetical protein